MKPHHTINHVIPWSEVSLLSSSKKQRVNRICGSRIIHKQSANSRAIKLKHTIERIAFLIFFAYREMTYQKCLLLLTLCPTMVI